MRCGLSLWLICLATICFLAGYRESWGQEAGQAPATAVAHFDAAQAKVHQTAWADHLGVPVESTNSFGMKMVLIPPGEFMMGSPASEAGRWDNEAQHTVTLSKAFSIGVYEVTQSQSEQVMGSNPSHFKGANNPVEMVSWHDAVAFCGKLSALPAEVAAGRVYRLPTEVEWEYACRAGTTTAYSFGDSASELVKYGWFDDNSGYETHAVGERQSNALGLYDIHGNVWEWCSDEAEEDSNNVLRGGGWFDAATFCRSASRGADIPSLRTYVSGFRLALSSPSVKSPEAEPGK